jgi:hypothetical protein
MPKTFQDRHFPVRPNLDQLKHQAKDLLQAIRRGDEAALDELRTHHPKYQSQHLAKAKDASFDPSTTRLADAQIVLARSYGLASWPRLVTACRMTDAIWRGDINVVREIILKNPPLLREAARGVQDCNWGPPMSYAANVGQDAIIQMLGEMGASDVQYAFERACLQGNVETARRLHAMGARSTAAAVMGCCETLNDAGMRLLLDLGAELCDQHGNRLAPVAMLLQTYSRYPVGKHRCLELVAGHGIEMPATPVVAVHRGRIDLLEGLLRGDPAITKRTFSLDEIYPAALGCGPDLTFGLHGTPLDGTTLLHICVEFDEIEIARWLIDHGADVNARAAIDGDGFGGQTPLFHCVVNNSYVNGRQSDGEFVRLLLDHGADPNASASLRKRLRFVPDESMHEYRDVTPMAWGERFHGQQFHYSVSKPAMRWIAERGGHV